VEGPKVEVIESISLSDAGRLMRSMGVHPGGIAIMAPKAVFRLVRLEGVDPRAAVILKQEMLARGGDAALPRSISDFSPAPADLLLMGTLHQYSGLIRKLYAQPWYGLERVARALGEALEGSVPGWVAPRRPSEP
jgi:dihydropteroate synthase